MRQTPATENCAAKRMNTPCGTTADVTMEGLLISKGCGKEEAGDADMGIGGHTGRAKKNGAEEAPFVFIGLKGKVMIRGGSGKNRKRDVDHMISGRIIGRLISRHIVRNLDGRRNERDMRDMRDMLNTRRLRHRGTLPSVSTTVQFYSCGGECGGECGGG